MPRLKYPLEGKRHSPFKRVQHFAHNGARCSQEKRDRAYLFLSPSIYILYTSEKDYSKNIFCKLFETLKIVLILFNTFKQLIYCSLSEIRCRIIELEKHLTKLSKYSLIR